VLSPASEDDVPAGFPTSLDHITAELERLDVLLRVQVRRNWRTDEKALREFGFLLTS